MAALKRDLPALQEGLSLLRRMDTDLSDEARDALAAASTVHEYYWPQLLPLAPPQALHQAAAAISEHWRALNPGRARPSFEVRYSRC